MITWSDDPKELEFQIKLANIMWWIMNHVNKAGSKEWT